MWLFLYFVIFFRHAPACIECFLQVFLPMLPAILSFGLLGKSGQLNHHYGHPLRGCRAMVEITITFFIVLFLKIELNVQNRLNHLFIIGVNHIDLFSNLLKTINIVLVVIL